MSVEDPEILRALDAYLDAREDDLRARLAFAFPDVELSQVVQAGAKWYTEEGGKSENAGVQYHERPPTVELLRRRDERVRVAREAFIRELSRIENRRDDDT